MARWLSGGLTFNGLGSINVGQIADPTANILNIGALTTSGDGTITLNVLTASSHYVNNQPYTLLNYNSKFVTGTNLLSAFAVGAVAGTGSRTGFVLADTGTSITLTLDTVSPVWTGLKSAAWNPAGTPVGLAIQLVCVRAAARNSLARRGAVRRYGDRQHNGGHQQGNVDPSLVTFNFNSSFGLHVDRLERHCWGDESYQVGHRHAQRQQRQRIYRRRRAQQWDRGTWRSGSLGNLQCAHFRRRQYDSLLLNGTNATFTGLLAAMPVDHHQQQQHD